MPPSLDASMLIQSQRNPLWIAVGGFQAEYRATPNHPELDHDLVRFSIETHGLIIYLHNFWGFGPSYFTNLNSSARAGEDFAYPKR